MNATAALAGRHLSALALLLFHLLIFQASGTPIRPGDSLTQISPTNISRSYVGITDAGSRLFRISSRGDVEMSEDNGASWTDRSPGVLARLRDITWTGSRLVAVGDDGLIITSDDLGLSWQNRPSNASGYYHSVTWTGTHLLATGVNTQTSQSSDMGNTWETYYFNEGGQFYNAVGLPGAWAMVGGSHIFGSPDNGNSWYEFYTPVPGAGALRDLVYTGSEYILVGESGTILRSTNLTTWTLIPSGTTAHLLDVHWNGFQLFAVGGRMYSNHSEPETLLTSSDGGLTWTTKFSGNPGSLEDIAGGPSHLTAVGLDDLSLRSADGGITWNQTVIEQTDPPQNIDKIIDHHGILVSIGDDFDTDSGVVSTSSDGGRTWADQNLQASRFLFDVTSVGNRVVIVGSPGKVRVSDDNGVTWQNKDIGGSDYLIATANTGSALIAVGANSSVTGPVIYRSINQGNTWTPISYSASNYFYAAASSGTTVIAAGNGGIMARSTDDGLTWNPVSISTSNRFTSIGAGTGYMIAATEGGEVFRSTDDGASWTPAEDSAISGGINQLAFDGATWFGQASNGLAYSTDGGITWKVRSNSIIQSDTSIVLQDSNLILVNASYRYTLSSSDSGIAWKPLNFQVLRPINSITKGGGKHVVMSGRNQIMTSTDRGDSWTIHFGPRQFGDLHEVTYTESGTFIAVGQYGEVASSVDAATWTQQSFPNASADLRGISSNGSTIVAVADDGFAYLSSDEGVTWTAHAIGSASGLYDVTFGNGLFVAVGESGVIFTSPDGQTWTSRSSGTTQLLWEVIWTGTNYIVAGGNSQTSNGGGILLRSSNGSSWTTEVSGQAGPPEGLAAIGSRVVAMGHNSLHISDDHGDNWTVTTTSIPFVSDLIWDGQRLLIGCGNNNLWYSEGNAEGLTALGLAPNIQIRDASNTILSNPAATVSFPSTNLGSSSGPMTFTIENTGNATLLDLGILPSGTHLDDFPLNSGGAPSFLDPGSSATFTVDFAPTESGTRSASLLISSNDSGDPTFVIPLTGTGNEATPLDLFNDAAAIAGLTGPDALTDATPFFDTVTNLEKYAFNMNLTGPDTHQLTPAGNSGLPLLQVTPGSSDLQWSFSYIRRIDSGLTYSPQTSSTLANASFIPMTGSETVTPIDDNWERVTIHETFTGTIPSSRFGRVDVTLPPNP